MSVCEMYRKHRDNSISNSTSGYIFKVILQSWKNVFLLHLNPRFMHHKVVGRQHYLGAYFLSQQEAWCMIWLFHCSSNESAKNRLKIIKILKCCFYFSRDIVVKVMVIASIVASESLSKDWDTQADNGKNHNNSDQTNT